jgi:hypothetical protein
MGKLSSLGLAEVNSHPDFNRQNCVDGSRIGWHSADALVRVLSTARATLTALAPGDIDNDAVDQRTPLRFTIRSRREYMRLNIRFRKIFTRADDGAFGADVRIGTPREF